jgi:citrate synthase
MPSLKEKFAAKMVPMRDKVSGILKEHGQMKVGDVSIAQAYGGMRSVKCMVWETSALDPMEGIRFRGFTIPELQQKLPKAPGGEEPLPEGIFYLLLTGELPTDADVAEITQEWQKRSALPQYALDIMKALPADMHPMTQFSHGILALQKDSVFSQSIPPGCTSWNTGTRCTKTS